jgi:hypothetical protein
MFAVLVQLYPKSECTGDLNNFFFFNILLVGVALFCTGRESGERTDVTEFVNALQNLLKDCSLYICMNFFIAVLLFVSKCFVCV